MDTRIIGLNQQGGRIIEVFLPLAVTEAAREITDLVEKGELDEETTARDRWLNQVQPAINRALGGLETSWSQDQIVLRTAASISTLKSGRSVILPSGVQVGSLNRAQRRALGSSSFGLR